MSKVGIPESAAPWSFSKWKAFNTCPQQYLNDRVLKRYPQKESEAMRYGTEFHLAAEEYIRDGKPLPPYFMYTKQVLDDLDALEGHKFCEQKLGVTENLEPTKFMADDVWWRGIGDLNIVNGSLGWSIDYKTGANAKYADKGQLELMALGMFTHYPELDKVRTGLLFVVAKAMPKATFKREQVPELWDKWISNFNTMQASYDNNVWNCKESGLCRKHCPVLECVSNGKNHI